MKKIILLTGLLFYSLILFAQKISNVDFDTIKKSLDATPGLYQQLLDRFVRSDITLTKDDYNTLYYGQCFQKNYNPYGIDSKNFDEFRKHYQAANFEKALPYALKMIENNPMDMEMTLKAMLCHHNLKDEESLLKMSLRYNNIMLSIFESGNGKSATTAFVVMCISDEYVVMANMKVQNAMQSKVGDCDVMTLKQNDFGIEKLYFNVSKLFEALKNKFKD